jgi:uncharacterized membrane protein
MSLAIPILVIAALLGSALMAGVFFAFSAFIMRAFAEIPCASGVRAMRSINRVILNPWFLVAFMGTTLISLPIGILALMGRAGAGGPWLLAAVSLYLVGTFLPTAVRNVPLNHQLDRVTGSDVEAFWQHYLKTWTHFNHYRTLSSTLAVIFYGIALLQLASSTLAPLSS